MMKYFFYLFFIFRCFVLVGQEVSPNKIRKNVYNVILNDVTNKGDLSIKMAIDPTINKFKNLEMNEFGLNLDSVEYVNDFNFCTKLSPYKCVSKLEIDNYKILDMYKSGKEDVLPVFYGVYSPIDSWYNLIYYAAVNHFEKNKSFQFQVILPVRKVWIENKKMKEQMIFYKFWFDEKFKILKFNKTVLE